MGASEGSAEEGGTFGSVKHAMKVLNELRQVLVEGQRRSMQGSYERRAPARKAIPYLIEARAGLRQYVEANGKDAEGWRLLAQAEECLLNFEGARQCLEKAVALAGKSDKKDLKRMVLLKEYQAKWSELALSPAELEDLGRHLDQHLREEGCDHTLRYTKAWLQQATYANVTSVIAALRNHGGYCDCEVLANVVRG
jgi:hypothetical protein